MKYSVTLFAVLLLSACGTAPVQTVAPQTTYVAPQDDEAQMSNLAIYAMSLHDTPYQYGGASRSNGFDCSGFVQFVFQNSLGLNLPRTSAEMGRIGTPMDAAQLRPGDLVFFNTTRSMNSHVGIFIGENRFVHSPKTGKAIMITSLNEKYWHARYNGARRITPNKQFAVNN
ncbi:MAG: NlpC/P60 family protein [Nitrosomonadales bacterium]